MIISAQYFKDRTIVTPNGCWIWTRSVGGRDYRIGKGYGKLGLNGKIVSAHRLAKKFGVCPQQISRIIRGTRWKLSTT